MAQTKTLTTPELAAFCGQLCLVVKAGLSPYEGIASLREDTPQQEGKALCDQLLATLQEGRPLWFALRESGAFPTYLVDMVEIGESTGRLDEVLDSLCTYYENSEALAKSIRQAVTYPLVMILLMGVVIALLVYKVLPIFQQVFAQLGSELSLSIQQVLRGGEMLTGLAVCLITLLLLLTLGAVLLNSRESGRQTLRRIFSRFPLTRQVSQKISASRFASAMSLMLASGLHVEQAVEMAGQLVEDPAAQGKIALLRKEMEQGASFAAALGESQLFSAVNTRLVALAFRTGAMDQTLGKIAQRYEEEVDDTISRAVAVLEPTLVAVLSTVVGLILLSVMLPLMGIMSSIG